MLRIDCPQLFKCVRVFLALTWRWFRRCGFVCGFCRIVRFWSLVKRFIKHVRLGWLNRFLIHHDIVDIARIPPIIKLSLADDNEPFFLKPFQSLYYGWLTEHTRGAECC